VIEIKRLSLVKPTVQTRFHIDFEWWSQNDNDWRVFLRNLLCAEHRQAYANFQEEDYVDWVDVETAEVQRVDGLQHVLITHCAKEPGFITEHTTMVDAIFRWFLANGNDPLTPNELGEKLNRRASLILAVLTGAQVYRGLRPII